MSWEEFRDSLTHEQDRYLHDAVEWASEPQHTRNGQAGDSSSHAAEHW
jgi:hypothetical protein